MSGCYHPACAQDVEERGEHAQAGAGQAAGRGAQEDAEALPAEGHVLAR